MRASTPDMLNVAEATPILTVMAKVSFGAVKE